MNAINKSEVFLNHALKTALNVVTHFDDIDDRNKNLEQLKDIITKNCFHDEKLKKLTDTINEVVDNINPDDKFDEVIDKFKNQVNEIISYNPDVSNHPNVKKYCSEVKEIVDDADGATNRNTEEDDDVLMTQTDINIIDPFTKKQMTNPVKNKICGHVYDRESVTSILKIRKDIRCPVIGCISKQFILEENLVVDINTRKYLQKKI